MSVFEHLRPFVSLCQACGMIPFTIEQNLITNKFLKFTLSFRRFTVWWFIIIFLLQLAVIVFMVNFSKSLLDTLSSDRNIPITLTIMNGVTMFSYSAQLLLSRWIVLHYRKLRIAVEAVQEVERLYGEKFIKQHRCSLVNRFIIAFILIVITNIFSLFLLAPAFRQFLPADMGILLTIALYFMLSLINVIIANTVLFIHMSYYIIAHYIQLLFIKSEQRPLTKELPMTSRKGAENIKEFRRNALIFDYLCKASSQLNNIFSVPVLLILTVKFVTVISSAFTYIYRFTYSNAILDNSMLVIPFFFIYDWIQILAIFTAADMPVFQVRLLRERLLCAWSYSSGLSKTLAENITEMAILMQIKEDRIRLSAAGMFNVGIHLIPGLAGAVVTYMVILLQN